MKRRIYFIVMLLPAFYLLPQNNYAQRQLITSTINTNNFKQQVIEKRKIIELIEHASKTGSVNIFQFDSTVLKDPIFYFNIFSNEPLKVITDESDIRSENDYSLYCHIQGLKFKEGSLVLTYLNGELSGNLNYKFKNYAIHPLGKGRFAAYEIDFKEFPQDDAPVMNKDIKNGKDFNVQKPVTNSMRVAAPACRIRILVAFTPDAETKIKNGLGYSTMVQFINQAIAETNQSYLNSGVNYRVELACGIRVGYIESGDYDTDLGRFESADDGYMDEIHGFRDSYSADVCALVFNNSAYCGLASAIQADPASAFCEVHYDCVLGNYSFGHEIAHLFGCRHDPETDGSTTPFAYGHGYVYSPGSWRTVMAYPINNEIRLQYYSNPGITYNGVPMGTTDVSNNSRVLNETAGTVSAFRTTSSTLILNSSNSIINDEIGDATAISTILLEPGFQVLNNSAFNAYIKNCSDPIATENNFIANNAKEKNLKADKTLLNIYPNPTKGEITITVDRSNLENAQIIISDQFGKEVYKSFNKSGNNIKIDLSHLSNGVYYMKIDAIHDAITGKIILIK